MENSEQSENTEKSKFDLLKKTVDDMADSTSGWSRENKKKAFRFAVGIASASALITVLVGIEDSFPYLEEHETVIKFWFKVTILFLSGLNTVLAVWDGFFNHKQLWIGYGDTRNQMRALSLEMDFEPADTREESVRKYLERYNSILSHANAEWKELRSDDANPSGG